MSREPARRRRPAIASSAADSPSATPTPAVAAPVPGNRACYDYGYSAAVAPVAHGEPVPCDRDHTAITFAVGDLDTVVDGHLVSVDSDRVQAQVAEACPEAFERFVGGSVEARRLPCCGRCGSPPAFGSPTAARTGTAATPSPSPPTSELAPLVGRLQGVLARPLAAERYAMCGTAEPGTAGFRRVICSGATPGWR